eukprot:scaffold1265_cov366-Prasinococcus_capsulatus_cf.AAC.17
MASCRNSSKDRILEVYSVSTRPPFRSDWTSAYRVGTGAVHSVTLTPISRAKTLTVVVLPAPGGPVRMRKRPPRSLLERTWSWWAKQRHHVKRLTCQLANFARCELLRPGPAVVGSASPGIRPSRKGRCRLPAAIGVAAQRRKQLRARALGALRGGGPLGRHDRPGRGLFARAAPRRAAQAAARRRPSGARRPARAGEARARRRRRLLPPRNGRHHTTNPMPPAVLNDGSHPPAPLVRTASCQVCRRYCRDATAAMQRGARRGDELRCNGPGACKLGTVVRAAWRAFCKDDALSRQASQV